MNLSKPSTSSRKWLGCITVGLILVAFLAGTAFSSLWLASPSPSVAVKNEDAPVSRVNWNVNPEFVARANDSEPGEVETSGAPTLSRENIHDSRNATGNTSRDDNRQADSTEVASAKMLSSAFRSAASKVLPSVVAIENRPRPAQVSGQGGDGRENPFAGTPFEHLYRPDAQDRSQRRGLPPGLRGRQRAAMGSGVIVDRSGLILTNSHVVGGNGQVVVRLADGREYKAEDVWTDPKTDVALIRIKGASDLQPAAIGDSDSLYVGDWVLALGQPFGLESTVTAGIISGKGRAMGITAREDFLQTDAAINPGNSGGPLVNLNGEVIGINTAISSRSGGNDGVGFAVPINLAKWVADELVGDGIVERAYLGVAIQAVDQELADKYGVAPRSGLVIQRVQSGSPADRAGLRAGDLLLELNGEKVGSPNKLQTVVERTEVGQTYPLKVLRNGRRLELTFKPAPQPPQYGIAQRR